VREVSVSGMGCVCVRDVGGVCVSEMCLGVRCVRWEVCVCERGVCVWEGMCLCERWVCV